MTYTVLFQHEAPVSAVFTPFNTGNESKGGVINMHVGVLQTYLSPAEARKLAADLMTVAQQYETHLGLPIQVLNEDHPSA